jgi:hypothetical protein
MDFPFQGGSNDITGSRIYCCLHMVATLFLPSGSQFFRKNRPLQLQQFVDGVINTGDTCVSIVVGTGQK